MMMIGAISQSWGHVRAQRKWTTHRTGTRTTVWVGKPPPYLARKYRTVPPLFGKICDYKIRKSFYLSNQLTQKENYCQVDIKNQYEKPEIDADR